VDENMQQNTQRPNELQLDVGEAVTLYSDILSYLSLQRQCLYSPPRVTLSCKNRPW